MDDKARKVLSDIFDGLPREGVGDDAGTRRALTACCGLPAAPRVLDLGCGSGAQTLALADALPLGSFIAVDAHGPFLAVLRARADARGHGGRIETVQADMTLLPGGLGAFDLVWAEGSAYAVGIDAFLDIARSSLRANGCVAFSDLVWLTGAPPLEVKSFFAREYPAMSSVELNRHAMARHRFRLLADFTLPDSAWWHRYYDPLSRKLPEIERSYGSDALARSIIADLETEMEMRRRFASSYGYHFFVGRRA